MGHVIKGHGHVVPAGVMDARAVADEILASARRAADLTRADAEEERQRVLRQSHELGYQEGYEEGRAQAAAQMVGVLVASRAEADAMLARAEPEAVAIAAAMAERIVGRAVALEPAIMAEIAAEALAACQTRRGGVALRVHPDHLAAVEGQRRTLTARLGVEMPLDIVADESVERLGCVVDTAVGRVDARLSTLLAALTRALTGEELH
jgi:flagellar biosynthesis/type III secretory pathway protein FliH